MTKVKGNNRNPIIVVYQEVGHRDEGGRMKEEECKLV